MNGLDKWGFTCAGDSQPKHRMGLALHAVGRPFGALAATGSSTGDWIMGSRGDDDIAGGGGDDALFGRAGNDVLRGEDGDDALRGMAGDDTLDGGAGRDRLIGGDGEDVLISAGGHDLLTGGEGGDVFAIGPDPETGTVTITDFGDCGDILDLCAFDVFDFGTLSAHLEETRAGLRVALDAFGGPSVLLRGVDLADFTADDVALRRLLFSDDFDSGVASPDWVTRQPGQFVEDGWFHTRDTDGWPRDSLAIVHDGDQTWTDYAVSMKADFADGSPWEMIHVVLRADGLDLSSAGSQGSGYLLRFYGQDGWSDPSQHDTIMLQRLEAGDPTNGVVLAIAPYVSSDGPMDFDISVEGGRIRVSVDGVEALDVTDPDPLAYGGFGVGAIWEAEARFDDIVVAAIGDCWF
jgi:hypothetical protein